MLFHSVDDTLVTAWEVIKVMTLCEEAIKVRTSPPSATHMRAYMVVIDGEPSGTQCATPDREGNPQHSPHDHHPGGSSPCQLQASLGDLLDDELQQLMEDLCWEVTLRELSTPRDPPTTPWGNPVGNGDPNVDHQEVTCLRGGLEPLEQPLWPLPLHNQMEDQNPEDNLLAPSTHSTWWRCGTSYKHTGHGIVTWYPSYKHFQWQSHARQNGSVIQTMVPWGTVCKRPLPRVSGQRKYCTFSQREVADTARYMGPTASTDYILHKLTVIFCTVASFDVLMQNFCKVTHSNHEKVPSFAVGLEGTLNQIQLQCPGKITDWEVQEHPKECLFQRYANTLETQYDTSTAIPRPPILSSWLLPAKWTAKWGSLRQGEG